MARKQETETASALDLIEEAVHLLRLAPPEVAGTCYAGTLPFVLGLLWFWSDMSRSAFAENYCEIASLGVALLFVWMKVWHTIFAEKIRCRLGLVAETRWTLARIARTAAVQTMIHGTGLFVLPVCLILTAPFAWVYAFYQNALMPPEDGEEMSVKAVRSRAWEQAVRWPGQNHMILSILSLFGLFVFLNIGIALYMLPHMLKTFFGIETIFTLSGTGVLNTTFLAVLCGLTWLCMDPLIKTVYVLRCFYGSALKTGEDLKAELKSAAPRNRSVNSLMIIAVFLLVTCLIQPPVCSAQDSPPATAGSQTRLSPANLDQAISDVLEHPVFSWRMPREKKEKQERSGPLTDLLNWIADSIKSGLKTLERWTKKLFDWFEEIMPDPPALKPGDPGNWQGTVRRYFYVLIIVVAAALGFFVWRRWKMRSESPVDAVAEAAVPVPDLNDEDVRADALPSDQWLNLARELMEKGDLRLALRAIYLGTLAFLAERELIALARYKSNRDYERELLRRARDRAELLEIFSENVAVFDSVWYGSRMVTPEEVALFAARRERMAGLVRE